MKRERSKLQGGQCPVCGSVLNQEATCNELRLVMENAGVQANEIARKMRISPQYLSDLLGRRKDWRPTLVEQFRAGIRTILQTRE